MQYANDLQEFLVLLVPLFLIAGGVIVAMLIVLTIAATAVRVFLPK